MEPPLPPDAKNEMVFLRPTRRNGVGEALIGRGSKMNSSNIDYVRLGGLIRVRVGSFNLDDLSGRREPSWDNVTMPRSQFCSCIKWYIPSPLALWVAVCLCVVGVYIAKHLPLERWLLYDQYLGSATFSPVCARWLASLVRNRWDNVPEFTCA